MKKLFFFKSSSSHGGEHREKFPATRDKKEMQWKTVHSENKFQNRELFSPISDRKIIERKTISKSLVLRRSRSLSMSSTADDIGGVDKEDPSRLRARKIFPSSNSGVLATLCDRSDCDFHLLNKHSEPGRQEVLCDHGCACPSNSCSPRNSFHSTSLLPGQVLDLYIDGEHHQEVNIEISNHRPSNTTSLRSCKERPKSSSSSNLFFPSNGASRDSLRSENQHESPKKLAKDVVERLLRMEQFRDSKPSPNFPQMSTTLDDISRKSSPCKDIKVEYGTLISEQKEDDTDSLLRRKSEEVKKRAIELSRELGRESSYQYYAGNLSSLSKMIRDLIEEKRNLMFEISDQLQCRITERAAAKEAVFSVKEEMNSSIMKFEREKDEMKSRLHKELERRSHDWEFKLREFQSEEHRLRDRVRELAEQNVCLQREVSSFYHKEKEYTDKLSLMEVHIEDLTAKMDVSCSENHDMQKNLSGIQDKLKVAEETQSSMERDCKEKEKENVQLIKAVARLQGTCNEQERTIDGLRQILNLEIGKSQSSDNLEKNHLQMEHFRLTEAEHVLRKQLETSRIEAESLRHENIYLLDRLKGVGKVGGPSYLKLDQELESFVQCLQNEGLSLLNDSIQLCVKLLGILKKKTSHEGFLEAHFLIDYDIKVQGFKQGLVQLTRSLAKGASILKEKVKPENCEPDLSDTGNGRLPNLKNKVLEDDLKSELKAQSLLTSILKEKLYSKEKEVEQLEARLARTIRNHEIFETEILNAFDTISQLNLKMKSLELQMIKKDGTINQLQGEVKSRDMELTTSRGTLLKVTQERDLMWEEVKQYSEKNMLLNCEVNSLKKKIEALEEDTLLKDGQISILKDSLNNATSIDLLFGSESDHGKLFKL